MKINENNNTTSNLSRRIIRSALLVGGPAFAAGFIGPLIFIPDNNLGPLFGIFITGPVGTLAGALLGIVRSAKNANTAEMKILLKWFLAIWGVTILYSVVAVVPALCLHGLIMVSGIFLLYNGEIYTRVSKHVKLIRPVIIITMAMVILMTLFPPVTRPEGVSKLEQVSTYSTPPLPKIAYRFDPRFDSSHHVPLFAINRRLLFIEWVMVFMVALAMNHLLLKLPWRNKTGTDSKVTDLPTSTAEETMRIS